MLNLFSESIGLVHKPVWIIWSLFIDYLFIHIKLIIIIMPPSPFSSGLNITVSVLCKSMGKKSTSIVLSWHKISFFSFFYLYRNMSWEWINDDINQVFQLILFILMCTWHCWTLVSRDVSAVVFLMFFFFFIINGFLLIFFYVYDELSLQTGDTGKPVIRIHFLVNFVCCCVAGTTFSQHTL